MGINRVMVYVVILFIITFQSCNPSNLTNREYREYLIQIIDREVSNCTVNNIEVRQKLLNYQFMHNDSLYNDESTYLFERAVLYLSIHEYVDAFELFRDYLTHTSDSFSVRYQIALEYYNIHPFSAKRILEPTLIEINNGSYVLPQSYSLEMLRILGTVFIYLMGEDFFSAEIKTTDIYDYTLLGLERSISMNNDPELIDDAIEHLIYTPMFSENVFHELLIKNSLSVYELDFLIDSFIDPLNEDFSLATFYADQRPILIEEEIQFPNERLLNIMKAYIGVGRYDDAISVFNDNENNIDERDLIESSYFLLLAVCYAGKGDLDASFDYLEKEIEVTELYDYTLNQASPLEQRKRKMAYSFYQFYFVYDEFEEFWQQGRYEEVRELFLNGMERYRDLEIFQNVHAIG